MEEPDDGRQLSILAETRVAATIGDNGPVRVGQGPVRYRLPVVRELAASGEMTCGEILPDVPKSSASHHWNVLCEGGVVEQRREGRRVYLRLRRVDLDSRFPGVLDAVVRG